MDHAHPTPSTKGYVAVWVALAVLLLASMTVSRFPLPERLIVTIVFALSTAKALLVGLYYMHLKFDRPWLAFVVAFPFVIIALAVGLVLSSALVKL